MQHVRVAKSLLHSYKASITLSTWIKPVLKVLGSQVLLQVMGFGISILLIREMPMFDYAIYTILISIQSMLIILSDSGLLLGFNAIGGGVWQNKSKMASLLKTASYLRARFSVLAFIVAAGYGLMILINQNVPYTYAWLIVASLVLIVTPEVHKAFIQQALLLKKEVGNVQLTSLIYQGTRLMLIGLIFILVKHTLTIQTVVLITIISVWLSFVFILKKSKSLRTPTAKVNPEYKSTLLHFIKVNWHNAAFYSFQGQISVFCIGIFGSTANLAELGALSRYSVIFTALTALVTNIFSPAFGRCQKKSKLINSYIAILVAILVLAFVTLSVVHLFPYPFLWVLGEQYQQLSNELFLVFVSCLTSLASSTIFHLNSFKGWIRYTPYWEIPANIVSLVVGVSVFDISTIEGVLHLSILSALTNLLLYAANSLHGFRHLKEV